MDLVRRHIPQTSDEARYDALLRAMAHANAHGITCVHHMCEPEEIRTLERAAARGDLTLRIHAYLSVDDWHGNIGRVQDIGEIGDMVRFHGFKGFMDGSLGSRNAYMRAPYADAGPNWRYPRGQLTDFADPPEAFTELVVEADAAHLQCAVHAIGDEVNHLLLEAYEQARSRNGARDARHRIEHAQHLLCADIPRFAALGVVASMQPYHKADDGRYAEKALGVERLRCSYAYRKLVDSGALVVFGSDWPIVTLDPFLGMDAAVNARTLAGDVWLPDHSLTVEEALRAYTVLPHRAVHAEREIGTLSAGKLADFVILSEDPLTAGPERLGAVKAETVVVNGSVVYQAN